MGLFISCSLHIVCFGQKPLILLASPSGMYAPHLSHSPPLNVVFDLFFEKVVHSIKKSLPFNSVHFMSNDPNVFNVFESVMAGAGSSIEGIAKRIGQLAEQTTQAKQITSLAVDRIYKSNIKLDTFIKATGKGTIQVSFTLGNLSPLPIKSAQATLKLEHPSVDIRIAKEANVFDDTNLETHVAQSFFDTPIDLSPQTEYEQLIELHVSNAVQCDGVIEISLVNLADPSSLVFIKHAFGVYLIDQLVVGEVDESKKETLDVKRMEEYPIEFVREMMNIHPTQGINLGTRCQYSDNKNVITCEVTRVSVDNKDAMVEFSGNDRDFLAMFVTELNKVKIKTGGA